MRHPTARSGPRFAYDMADLVGSYVTPIPNVSKNRGGRAERELGEQMRTTRRSRPGARGPAKEPRIRASFAHFASRAADARGRSARLITSRVGERRTTSRKPALSYRLRDPKNMKSSWLRSGLSTGYASSMRTP